MDKETGRRIKVLFRQCQQHKPPCSWDAYEEAQVAVAEVVQALEGVVPEDKVINVAGNARSSNAVSRAVRTMKI